MRGHVEANAAARKVATIHRLMRKQPPAEQRFRNQEQDGRKTEQLHGQIREDGAGKAEQIVYRLLSGMAEGGILHRPGRERDGTEQRQRYQRNAGEFTQASPDDVAKMLRNEGNDIEAAICYILNRAPRRGDAAPLRLPSCPAP